MKKKILSIILSFVMIFSLTGCDLFKAKIDNNNDDDDWITTWDNIITSSYDDIEYMEDIFYDFCLFDSNILSIESVEVVNIEYKDIETYFDKDKIYTKLGLNLEPEKLLRKVAIGTGVIAVCLALNIMTAGVSSHICCIIAGAANGAITGAASGTIIGGIIGAVTNFISSDGDWREVGTGAIEGAVDGYMWGAIFGAISGAVTSNYCFTGDTLVYTQTGLMPISNIVVGDYVYSRNIETDELELSKVDELYVNNTNELVSICTENQNFKCTPNHTILTNHGWKYACEITEKDMLVSYNDEYTQVKSIENIELETEVNVYNLNIENSHTYCITNDNYIVHNMCINEEYAGRTYKYENILEDYNKTGNIKSKELYDMLISKYPDGVPFSQLDALGNTFPDFQKYVLWEYKFPPVNTENLKAGTCLVGNSAAGSPDFKLFRQKMLENGYTNSQISEILSKYTIHHHPDCQTLQLIPRDLHQAVRHKGGASLIRQIIANL